MKRLVKQELLFWVNILPDDISTPHMIHDQLCVCTDACVYVFTDRHICGQIIIQILYNEQNGISPSYLIKMRTANLNDAQLCKSTGY